VCRNCQQFGHMSRDCMGGPLMICHNCGGRGHLAYECPSGRFVDRYPSRRYWILMKCKFRVSIIWLFSIIFSEDRLLILDNVCVLDLFFFTW
jgi:hypothetical protein